MFAFADGSYTPSADDASNTAIAVGDIMKITFLDNTSKGSVAGSGTWVMDNGSCKGDQNALELKIELTAAATIKIHFNGDIANTKAIFMTDSSEKGYAGTTIANNEVVESGKKAPSGIAKGADDGIAYVLPAGTYIFYVSGTKWNFKSIEYVNSEADGISIVSVSSAAKTVKALENGQLVIKSAKGTFSASGARIK